MKIEIETSVKKRLSTSTLREFIGNGTPSEIRLRLYMAANVNTLEEFELLLEEYIIAEEHAHRNSMAY